MNCSDFSFRPPYQARLYAVFEIIMVSGIFPGFLVSAVFAAVFGRNRMNLAEIDVGLLVTYLMIESALTFLILWIMMKARGETFTMLGLRRQQWKTYVLLGILAAPLLMILGGVAGAAFQLLLPEYALEKNPLMDMIHSWRQLLMFLVTVITAGGIKEELQRAFILRRFHHHLGGARVGLIAWSLAFGAGHYAQGLQGVCVATVLGLVFGALYLARGNLILPMAAHVSYNTLALLIYWFVIGINR